MPAKIVPGRNALRSISGRKAGEDHARSQGPLRGERSSNPPFGDRLHYLHSVSIHKYRGAMRLRREVRLEKNIQEVMLGRASQEVMPGETPGEVMLALTRQEAKRKERSPTR